MAAKKPAPKAALSYDKKLLTAWKNLGERAAQGKQVYASKLLHEPGLWDALAAAFEAGKVPPVAPWRLGALVADHAPVEFAARIVAALPPNFGTLWAAYLHVAVLMARALQRDPSALDALDSDPDGSVRDLAELARAEAGLSPNGAPSPRVRAQIAAQWAEGGSPPPPLTRADGEVTRTAHPHEARWLAMRACAERLFGPTLAHDLAEAHRAQLAGRDERPAYLRGYPLSASPDALSLGASAMTPEEVCGFQTDFPVLAFASARWSLDEMVRAALWTRAQRFPGAALTASSVAILAIERDPSCAPSVEPALQLGDLDHSASASPGVALAALMRTPAEWRRHFVIDVVFAPARHAGVYAGPLGLVMLTAIDPEAAERIALERGEQLDATRIVDADPALLAPLLDAALPAVRGKLLLPVCVAYGRAGGEVPLSLDADFAFDGTHRDAWIAPVLFKLPVDRAVSVLRRELAAGRGEWAHRALDALAEGAALLARAEH